MVARKPVLAFISTRFLFPTDSGGKIRTVQILRGLKGGAFDICLVLPGTEALLNRYAEELATISDEVISWRLTEYGRMLNGLRKATKLWSRVPVPVMTDWSKSASECVESVLARQPDLVVFDFPHSAVLAPTQIRVPSVMFTHNIEAEIFKRHWEVARTPALRWLWRSQYRKMLKFEQDVLGRFDTTIAVSERDADYFQSQYGIQHCRSIPTGVDTEYFVYHPPESNSEVVFCGSMDWLANIDGIQFFHDKVWPIVRREEPAATMKVIGRNPPSSLVKRILADSPEWSFTGFVDDVRKHVNGTSAFVIPLRVGGGTRIKAFEAMAMGSPVVSTSIGVEGLPVEDNVHFLRADSPADMAASILSLLRNPERRHCIAEAARSLVQSEHNFRSVAEIFERICLDTIRRLEGFRA